MKSMRENMVDGGDPISKAKNDFIMTQKIDTLILKYMDRRDTILTTMHLEQYLNNIGII